MIVRLEAWLEARPQIQVVGTFPTRRAARDGIPKVAPEVVIIDADLTDGAGADLCADLRLAGCRLSCIVLSGLPLPSEMADESAVDAVVLKSLTDDNLVRQILRLAGRSTDGGEDRSR